MLFSKNLLFSDQQAVTASAASTNILDLGATGIVPMEATARPYDIGPGTPIPLLIQVTEAFAGLTSLDIDLQLDSSETFTPDKTIKIASAVPVASLVPGYQAPFSYVPDQVDLRYMRLLYTVNGSDASAGKITAGITMGNQKNG